MSIFRDLLGTEKSMETCHKPKGLNDLVVPSKIKASQDPNLQVSMHVGDHKTKYLTL